jgi:hypothetical protein
MSRWVHKTVMLFGAFGVAFLAWHAAARSEASPVALATDARAVSRAGDSGAVMGAPDPTGATGAVRLAGQFGGISPAVAVADRSYSDFVWVARGPRVLLMDAEDPAAPVVVAQTDVLPGIVHDLAVADGVVYAAVGADWLSMTGAGALRILEPGTGARVEPVAEYPLPATGMSVSVDGDRAYVAAYTAGLQILDVKDPRHPTLLGVYAPPDRAITSVIHDEDRDIVFLGSSWWDAAVDVSDPRAPQLLGERLAPTGLAFHLALSGSYLLSPRLLGGVAITDMSDPTRPEQRATYETPGLAFGVAADSERAYVAGGRMGLHAIQHVDGAPDGPQLLDAIALPGIPWDVDIARDRVFVSSLGSGDVSVVDVAPQADAPPMRRVGTVASFNSDAGVAVEEGLAYGLMANDQAHDQLRVLDVSEPSRTRLVGTGAGDLMTDTQRLVVQGGVAYVASGVNGLQVVDLTPPTQPRTVGHLGGLGFVSDVAVEGSVALVAARPAGLKMLDVTDMVAPRELEPAYRDAAIQAVELRDGAAFALTDHALLTFDTAQPRHPVLLAALDLPVDPEHPPVDLVVDGDLAVITYTDGGFILCGVSDVRVPRVLGVLNAQVGVDAVAIVEDHVLAVVNRAGLQLVDVSDPTAPVTLGAFATTPGFNSVTTVGDTVYAVGALNGVHIFTVRTHKIHLPLVLTGRIP